MRTKWIQGALLALAVTLAGCHWGDRGLSKLQIVDDLLLGSSLDDIKQQWFLFSTRSLVVDQALSTGSDLVYRGVSRDPSVTGFYFFFDTKTQKLHQVEWRYQSSMTESKEQELLEHWTRKLGEPAVHQRWGGKVHTWSDRKAALEIYHAEGVCHLVQRLN